jgi:histidinol dehydrogenase
MRKTNPEIYAALELAADHITHFALRQKAQFSNFEYEMESGLFTGQRVIPVERAAVYVPAGRFPLFSTVLMGLIPAFCAGVDEVILASPPLENGMPDGNVLAAAGIAAACIEKNGMRQAGGLRAFALGGAQAIAALALGTETVPRVDVIAGPGNKYVAAAKRILSGETGIDFIAGPTDVLVIADGSFAQAADLAAADMLAQAEHDPDARARALVSCRELADEILAALERRLASLPTEKTARASLDAGGLIIIYHNREEAIRIANAIAPEHLEIQTSDADNWIPHLRNYGSLFAGALAAEALGDYSAGINHTLPTSGSARFTGGLSVRHFLKTVTTLRCAPGQGFENACRAAEIIARAEGLIAHAESAAARLPFVKISD